MDFVTLLPKKKKKIKLLYVIFEGIFLLNFNYRWNRVNICSFILFNIISNKVT